MIRRIDFLFLCVLALFAGATLAACRHAPKPTTGPGLVVHAETAEGGSCAGPFHCDAGLFCCPTNHICRNLQTDNNNCGSCGASCFSGTSAATCSAGKCTLPCPDPRPNQACNSGKVQCFGQACNESSGACGAAGWTCEFPPTSDPEDDDCVAHPSTCTCGTSHCCIYGRGSGTVKFQNPAGPPSNGNDCCGQGC